MIISKDILITLKHGTINKVIIVYTMNASLRTSLGIWVTIKKGDSNKTGVIFYRFDPGYGKCITNDLGMDIFEIKNQAL